MPQTPPSLHELMRVPFVDPEYRFDLSPDGTRIAYAHNGSGQWEIYVLDLEGGAAAHRITAGPGAKRAPRWSPDGMRLAYGLDLEGGERFDIHTFDFAQARTLNLTPRTDDAILPSVAWSPDGAQVAFISDRHGCFSPYRMPSSGGPVERVAESPTPCMQVDWSPDGQWLALVVAGRGQDFETHLVPAAGGRLRPIADGKGPALACSPVWSHDSAQVVFSALREGRWQIGRHAIGSDTVAWIARGERDLTHPAWDSRSELVVAEWNDGPSIALAMARSDDPMAQTVDMHPGTCAWPRITPAGDRLYFLFQDPCNPPDLWSLPLPAGPPRRLTRSLPEGLRQAAFLAPESIRYPSLDGQAVPALLYRAPDAGVQPSPAVISVHGGPDWLSSLTWDPITQHMLGRGWTVLAPNYRGSIGHGRDWQLANRFDMGGKDAEDIAAGAAYLVREGLADPRRIAVVGASYGGYLTMVVLTRFPELWAAGSAVVPFLNWFSCYANERQDLRHWDRENMGDPTSHADLLRERSPFFALDRIAAPVQLICGAHDPRCPASESRQAYEALISLGKPCDLVLYEDEGHHLSKTANRLDAFERQVAFLASAFS